MIGTTSSGRLIVLFGTYVVYIHSSLDRASLVADDDPPPFSFVKVDGTVMLHDDLDEVGRRSFCGPAQNASWRPVCQGPWFVGHTTGVADAGGGCAECH